jgi:hypothetical protein
MEPTVVLQLIASEYLQGSSHQFLFDVRWSQQQKSGWRGGMGWDGMRSDKSADSILTQAMADQPQPQPHCYSHPSLSMATAHFPTTVYPIAAHCASMTP